MYDLVLRFGVTLGLWPQVRKRSPLEGEGEGGGQQAA